MFGPCHNLSVSPRRALILIWLIVAGQLHACSSAWILPDGSKCPACPIEPCIASSSLQCQNQVKFGLAASNDCHDCCKLSSCGDHQETPKAVQSQQHDPVLAILAPTISPAGSRIVVCSAIFTHIEEGFPNAPPSASSSRAPPFQLS